MDITAEEEALVECVINETLQGFDQITDPAELTMMRELIRADLLYSAEGQRRLRQLRADPTLLRSGDVARDPSAPSTDSKKKGRSA
ncbi:MAG: hypothetical protein U0414_36030 [Polyangiaceae bacterium]|mgnify:CR=1 FL=1